MQRLRSYDPAISDSDGLRLGPPAYPGGFCCPEVARYRRGTGVRPWNRPSQRNGNPTLQIRTISTDSDGEITTRAVFGEQIIWCLPMRALIFTVAVALLLYGTSLFSRDRESPRWARVADSARQEDQPARFESLTALVKSVDDISTGSVEVRDRRATPPPAAAPEYALQSTTAPPVRVEKRLTPKRNSAADSNSDRSQGQRRQVATAAQAASTERMADAPSPSERGSQTATPIEYSLADRGN